MAAETVWKQGDYSVRWNGGATFNVYQNSREIDVFTHYGDSEGGPVKDKDEAKRIAAEHMREELPNIQAAHDQQKGHWYTR